MNITYLHTHTHTHTQPGLPSNHPLPNLMDPGASRHCKSDKVVFLRGLLGGVLWGVERERQQGRGPCTHRAQGRGLQLTVRDMFGGVL